MIRKTQFSPAIEHYEQYITLKNQRVYQLRWKARVLPFYTCGGENNLVECLDCLLDSIVFREVLGLGTYGVPLSLEAFNALNIEEPLYFNSNCHGFTFADGKYFISNYFVNCILSAEYEEVTDKAKIKSGDFDVLCLKDKTTGEWIHSCKYQYDLFLHKEGFRKFAIHTNEAAIEKISEYAHTSPHYYKRKQRICRGICLNAVGEPFFKTFENEVY